MRISNDPLAPHGSVKMPHRMTDSLESDYASILGDELTGARLSSRERHSVAGTVPSAIQPEEANGIGHTEDIARRSGNRRAPSIASGLRLGHREVASRGRCSAPPERKWRK